MGLFDSKYPTEWEAQDPVYLTKTIERKKYQIMLDNGEEIVVEADYARTSGGSRYFYDIGLEDLRLTTQPSIGKNYKYELEHKLELKEDEIAAVRNEKVSETTYEAENVKIKERKNRERVHGMGYTVQTEKRFTNRPEIVRQNDTE